MSVYSCGIKLETSGRVLTLNETLNKKPQRTVDMPETLLQGENIPGKLVGMPMHTLKLRKKIRQPWKCSDAPPELEKNKSVSAPVCTAS